MVWHECRLMPPPSPPRTVSPPICTNEMGNYGGEHWTRHRFQANVTAQELAETYLPAFRACVMAGNPAQVMCSYNSIAVRGGDHVYNSTPACLDGDIQNRQMRDQCTLRLGVEHARACVARRR